MAYLLPSRSRSASSLLPRRDCETFSSAPLFEPGLTLALCETVAIGSRSRDERETRASSEWAGSDDRLSGYETPLTTNDCRVQRGITQQWERGLLGGRCLGQRGAPGF